MLAPCEWCVWAWTRGEQWGWKMGNWKLFSLQRIWVEFRNNIALDNLRVSSNERYLQRAWIPVWNAQSDVRWWGVCAGPDVSRFTTLTRSGPGCGDNMQAYIIQEAEQINQCIMSLKSEKLHNWKSAGINMHVSYNIMWKVNSRVWEAEVWSATTADCRMQNGDALQIETLQNKTKYFRLRLTDEVGTERPEADPRLT